MDGLAHLNCDELLEYEAYLKKHIDIMLKLYDEHLPDAPSLEQIDDAAELHALVIEEYLRQRCASDTA